MNRIKDFFRKITPVEGKYIVNILAVSGVVIAFIGTQAQREGVVAVMAIIGIFMILAAVAALFAFWRCPSCRQLLPTRGVFGMQFCPYCAGPIDKDNEDGETSKKEEH
jgi:hypothetical protein